MTESLCYYHLCVLSFTLPETTICQIHKTHKILIGENRVKKKTQPHTHSDLQKQRAVSLRNNGKSVRKDLTAVTHFPAFEVEHCEVVGWCSQVELHCQHSLSISLSRAEKVHSEHYTDTDTQSILTGGPNLIISNMQAVNNECKDSF